MTDVLHMAHSWGDTGILFGILWQLSRLTTIVQNIEPRVTRLEEEREERHELFRHHRQKTV